MYKNESFVKRAHSHIGQKRGTTCHTTLHTGQRGEARKESVNRKSHMKERQERKRQGGGSVCTRRVSILLVHLCNNPPFISSVLFDQFGGVSNTQQQTDRARDREYSGVSQEMV